MIPAHVGWLRKTDKQLKTKDGLAVDLWVIDHSADEKILSGWAKHFRDHYADDATLDKLRKGTGYTRKEFLIKIKFPSNQRPGPSIRSGDFAEILIADYVEYVLGYWVPRIRYENKDVPDESKKGSDIMGFKISNPNKFSPEDELLVFESKAQLSGDNAKAILQDAIDNSGKDELRKAFSLNAAKHRMIDNNKTAEAQKIERFQNPEDNPYRECYGAAALFSTNLIDETKIKDSDCSKHPHKTNLSLLVISGNELMKLVNQLYDIAANEA